MSNIIDKIQLSGTNYDIQDSNAAKVVEITQENYDLLPTSAKTANIMYVITDATPIDVSNYYTKSETSGATELATAFAATQPKLSAGTNITIDANNVISASGGGGGGIDSGTVQTMIDESISGKADTSSLATVATSGSYDDLTNKPTIPTVPTSNTAFTNDAGYITSSALDGYATQTWVGQQGYLTQHQDISGKQDVSGMTAYTEVSAFTAHTSDANIHVTTAQTAAWNAKSNFSGSYNDLTDKPTIPSKTSDLTNDSNFATSGYVDTKLSISDFNTYSGTVNTAIGNKANSSDVYTKSQTSGATEIATALSGKQDTLSAGTNITISGNVISAEGGGSITIDPSLDSGSTNAVANSAITTALNDTVKLSNLSTYYINGFTNYVNRTIPIFHRFDINNQSNGNAWWFGKINDKYVITTGQTSVTPSDLMNLQVVETSAITTSITSSSTDVQVPSAKAVNDKLGGLSIVKLTQSEYDALTTKDSSTIYFIVG